MSNSNEIVAVNVDNSITAKLKRLPHQAIDLVEFSWGSILEIQVSSDFLHTSWTDNFSSKIKLPPLQWCSIYQVKQRLSMPGTLQTSPKKFPIKRQDHSQHHALGLRKWIDGMWKIVARAWQGLGFGDRSSSKSSTSSSKPLMCDESKKSLTSEPLLHDESSSSSSKDNGCDFWDNVCNESCYSYDAEDLDAENEIPTNNNEEEEEEEKRHYYDKSPLTPFLPKFIFESH